MDSVSCSAGLWQVWPELFGGRAKFVAKVVDKLKADGKKGNIVIKLMSVTQLDANITTRAASKTGKRLYDGNTEAIKQDISAMMDLHKSNTKTDKYYQDKYGPKWEEYQQIGRAHV